MLFVRCNLDSCFAADLCIAYFKFCQWSCYILVVISQPVLSDLADSRQSDCVCRAVNVSLVSANLHNHVWYDCTQLSLMTVYCLLNLHVCKVGLAYVLSMHSTLLTHTSVQNAATTLYIRDPYDVTIWPEIIHCMPKGRHFKFLPISVWCVCGCCVTSFPVVLQTCFPCSVHDRFHNLLDLW